MQKPKYNIIQRLLNRQIKDRSRLAAVAVQVLGFSFRGPLGSVGWRHFHLGGGGHTSYPTAASLAPGPRTSHLQERLVGFQGVARSVAAVSRG